jgi:hypothetical protein
MNSRRAREEARCASSHSTVLAVSADAPREARVCKQADSFANSTAQPTSAPRKAADRYTYVRLDLTLGIRPIVLTSNVATLPTLRPPRRLENSRPPKTAQTNTTVQGTSTISSTTSHPPRALGSWLAVGTVFHRSSRLLPGNDTLTHNPTTSAALRPPRRSNSLYPHQRKRRRNHLPEVRS